MKLFPAAILGVIVVLVSCGTTDPAKKYPNMVANADPVSAGSVEIQFARTFSSKMNKVEVETVFYPRLNSVALEFKYETVHYRQFWDVDGRKKFAQALEHYKADYADRKLINKAYKTRAVYGKLTGYVEWEVFRMLTKTYIAYPGIEIGYCFKNDAPFFATLMRSAREVDDGGSSTGRFNSQQIAMFFTRAQADELVKLFDQDYLMGLLSEKALTGEQIELDDDYYKEYSSSKETEKEKEPEEKIEETSDEE